jgi:hypothetical protein
LTDFGIGQLVTGAVMTGADKWYGFVRGARSSLSAEPSVIYGKNGEIKVELIDLRIERNN